MSVRILPCATNQDVLSRLREVFASGEYSLPADRNARILVKPNLNSNLDALTGNTTDLRVLAAVLRILSEGGYRNVRIMEGPNSGYHRQGVDVFARNSVDQLAACYGYRTCDVNYETETETIQFSKSGSALFASAFCTSDYVINLPKMKTHYETLVSASLKSLIGILVGQPNKAKAHADLIENILRLNDRVKPHLHILDGLIAMEGTGPSAGTPVRAGVLLVGRDAYDIDLVAGGLMGYCPTDMPLIREALKTGRITDGRVRAITNDLTCILGRPFRRPRPALLARLVVAPGVGRIVRAIRNSGPVSRLLRQEWIRKVLLRMGVTQEVILARERDVRLRLNTVRCRKCGKCSQYCPQYLDLPGDLKAPPAQCLHCLYCYAVCPESAIELEGTPGYYTEQIRRFGKTIRKNT
jgi:uncharacterized protein (DUF362 family)/Pyruvate/2-oxoacid:ferredoxin oxidoreductase delta subunit